jgi:flagellar hook-length control protein FliK
MLASSLLQPVAAPAPPAAPTDGAPVDADSFAALLQGGEADASAQPAAPAPPVMASRPHPMLKAEVAPLVMPTVADGEIVERPNTAEVGGAQPPVPYPQLDLDPVHGNEEPAPERPQTDEAEPGAAAPVLPPVQPPVMPEALSVAAPTPAPEANVAAPPSRHAPSVHADAAAPEAALAPSTAAESASAIGAAQTLGADAAAAQPRVPTSLPEIKAAELKSDPPATLPPADPLPGADRGAPEAAAPAEVPASVPSRATAETVAAIAARVAQRLEGRSTRFDMVLTPEDLGRVEISLEMDGDGQLAARLAFDNPLAAADLRGRADELRRQLETAGFQLAEGALQFSERDRSSGNAWSDGRRRGGAFSRGDALALEADAASAAPPRWITLSLTPDRVDVKV